MSNMIEKGQPSPIEARFAELYTRQPGKYAPEFDGWTAEVAGVSTDKTDFLKELVKHHHKFYELSAKGDERAQEINEVRAKVISDIAVSLGATELDLFTACLDGTPEGDRQGTFDMARGDGFDGMSYVEVGQLMEKYHLEW